jgi:hypothetical protein
MSRPRSAPMSALNRRMTRSWPMSQMVQLRSSLDAIRCASSDSTCQEVDIDSKRQWKRRI